MTVERSFGHNLHPREVTPLGDIIDVESMLNATRGFALAMFFTGWGLCATMRRAYYQWTDVAPLDIEKTITENTLLVAELGDCFAQKKEELMKTND